VTRQPHHNPDVETQAPGYCVFLPGPGLFLVHHKVKAKVTIIRKGMIIEEWLGGPSQAPKVYPTRAGADAAAELWKGVVTTVPRHNGYTKEWTELPPAPTVDDGWTVGGASWRPAP
jgi:hypothetical protein